LRKLATLLEFANKNVREQERKQIGRTSLRHRCIKFCGCTVETGIAGRTRFDHIRDSLRVPNLILRGTLVAPRAGSVTRHVTLDSETASAFGCDWRA
jgi:hypothetical protein